MARRRKRVIMRDVTRKQKLLKATAREQVEFLAAASEQVGALRERSDILQMYNVLDAEAFQEWLYERCK